MVKRKGETFLTSLITELRYRCPQWHLDDHVKIEWAGQPRSFWPEADILINMPSRRFVIEYDENSDPGRSLTKYWPILHVTGKAPLTIIEIWQRGPTIGRGYAELAEWMGARLRKLYPLFVYEFIERRNEPSEEIAEKVAKIVSDNR